MGGRLMGCDCWRWAGDGGLVDLWAVEVAIMVVGVVVDADILLHVRLS